MELKNALLDDVGVKSVLLAELFLKITLTVCNLDLLDSAECLLHALNNVRIVFPALITEARQRAL